MTVAAAVGRSWLQPIRFARSGTLQAATLPSRDLVRQGRAGGAADEMAFMQEVEHTIEDHGYMRKARRLPGGIWYRAAARLCCGTAIGRRSTTCRSNSIP